MRPELRAIVLGLTAGLVGLPLLGWGYFLTHMVRDGHTDFRATYTAGFMLRKGEPLYDPSVQFAEQNRLVSREQSFPDPFNHPAYEALIYLPLSFFSFVRAYWLWFLMNVAILAVIYGLLRAELNVLSAIAPCLPMASILAYIPFGVALMHGQDSILLTLLLAIAFSLASRDESGFTAGLMLGLGVFRFQILIPIALCFLFWRRWKLLVGFGCVAIPAAVLSAILGGFWPYVRLLMDFAKDGGTGTAQQIVSAMPNLRGLVSSVRGGSLAVLILSIAVFAIAIPLASRDEIRRQLAIAIPVALLVSYHSLMHDLSLLFVTCALILSSEELAPALSAIAIPFILPSLLLAFAPHHLYLSVFGSIWLFIHLSRRTQDRKVKAPPPLEAAVDMVI